MTVVEGTVLSTLLGNPLVQYPSLNPNVFDHDLERAYRGMAQVMLELSKPVFKYIGALQWNNSSGGGWRVGKQPFSQHERTGARREGTFLQAYLSIACSG